MRNVICIVLIIAMFGYTLFSISHMPETIPIHFSNGEADGWGSKWISLLIPIISLISYVGVLLYELHLKKRNRPNTLVGWMNLGTVILFAVLTFLFIQTAFS